MEMTHARVWPIFALIISVLFPSGCTSEKQNSPNDIVMQADELYKAYLEGNVEEARQGLKKNYCSN